MNMKRFCVIGSNSFSGGHFVDTLLDDSACEVIGISRSAEKSAVFLPYKKRKTPPFKFYPLDINRQTTTLFEILDAFAPEAVINFAAQGEVGTSWRYPHHWFETNAVGIVKLANGLKERPYLKRYVHISTPEVYGSCSGPVVETAPMNPSTPYAASKAAGDLFLFTLVKQYQFPLVMIRSTNVYGKHQQLYRIIPRAIINLQQGKKIMLHGGGKAVKSYIHIRDVCNGIRMAMEKGENGEIYHLSGEDEISIRDLVRKICERMGCGFESAVADVPDRPGQDARYSVDSTKARRAFGWAPKIGLDEGIKEIIEWIEEDWEQILKEPLEYIHQE